MCVCVYACVCAYVCMCVHTIVHRSRRKFSHQASTHRKKAAIWLATVRSSNTSNRDLRACADACLIDAISFDYSFTCTTRMRRGWRTGCRVRSVAILTLTLTQTFDT